MTKTAIPRNNFSSGIISQQLSGRIDLPSFINGLKTIENFLINLNGSISKRTGYELIGKNETTTESYFIKFLFNQEQVYLLEFKENNFRVWISTEDNKLKLYKENNEIKYWNHPYNFEDLKYIKTTQNFDVIYFCHNNYPPKTLTRTYNIEQGTINFEFKDVVFGTGTGTQNPVSIDGNPSCCCFYQQRLFYGGFKKQINKIWASDKGYYDKFTTNRSSQNDILDIDGFNFVLTELKLKILWMKDTTVGLILGTSQGIAIIKTDNGQLTPFNFSCNLINKDGASAYDPIIVGITLLYVDSTLKRIKALTYSWDENAYISTNLNILCPELIQENIIKICYQEDEKDLVYVLTEKGNLYYLLYSSSEMFYSWGKIKSYDNFKYIETLEKYDSGTNLFLIDNNNNILRKSQEIVLKQQEDFINIANNETELHNIYYDYIDSVINDFNYLDYSTEIYYKQTEELTFDNVEETELGIFSDLIAETEVFNKYSKNELYSMLIQSRDENNYLFEIREKITNYKLRVRILSKDFDKNKRIKVWSFNKNILDEFNNNIYKDGTDFTIIGDNYYYENIEIKNGKIELPIGIAIGRFRIGYNYKSLIKTMNLGGMVENQNTMIAKKNILKIYLRLYNSWGGKVGTNYYNLKDINYLKLKDSRYDEPYTLQEQDIRIDIQDKWEFNKSYWVVSDTPYPFNVNSITLYEEQN